jgi:hypothetical protein
MAGTQQNFNNHTRWRPPFHFFVIPVLLINFVIAVWLAVRVPGLATGWGAIFALGLFTFAVVTRAMIISVQDRVIRLEMRLRLRQVLPPDLAARIYELTPGQLVAMRFGSDEELPELTREVLAGSLPSAKAIKMRVKNWQADFLRA